MNRLCRHPFATLCIIWHNGTLALFNWLGLSSLLWLVVAAFSFYHLNKLADTIERWWVEWDKQLEEERKR